MGAERIRRGHPPLPPPVAGSSSPAWPGREPHPDGQGRGLFQSLRDHWNAPGPAATDKPRKKNAAPTGNHGPGQKGEWMKIGLVDVDGHHFPNLALMRISAYHKARGDDVEWWLGDLFHYDIVYMSKIFSDAYSPDIQEPMNADKVIKGGTGYCISLDEHGKEVFDQSKNYSLPAEMERMFPDYSIYPQYDFAVSMTSRGCPRGCSFCHPCGGEGRTMFR